MPQAKPHLEAGGGKVYLVGGGPGDPGLLTLRGRECLALADVVLYDYLVNPRVLAHARGDAELVCLGRHGQDRREMSIGQASPAAQRADRGIWPQEAINRRLVELARAGCTVVRL